MGVSRKIVIICDACGSDVRFSMPGDFYIDAMAYGRAFHGHCYQDLNAPLALAAMGIDDVYVRTYVSEGESERKSAVASPQALGLFFRERIWDQ